jgi:hypothetical protein
MTSYKAKTDIRALDYPIPEIDVACFDNIAIQSQLEIIKDPSYCHSVILDNIDISANVFKKLFYNSQKTNTTFNTFTNSFNDYYFQLLPAPPTAIDVSYNIDGTTYFYYLNLSTYISIFSPSRTIYQSGETFCLQDEILDNILEDLTSINPNYSQLFNTCSFIDFNKEVTNLKTLNDIIPSSNLSLESCSLDWSNILELARCEYDDPEHAETPSSTPKYVILMITLIFKTTVNLHMEDCEFFISTTEVKLRYKMDFNELPEFQNL